MPWRSGKQRLALLLPLHVGVCTLDDVPEPAVESQQDNIAQKVQYDLGPLH